MVLSCESCENGKAFIWRFSVFAPACPVFTILRAETAGTGARAGESEEPPANKGLIGGTLLFLTVNCCLVLNFLGG